MFRLVRLEDFTPLLREIAERNVKSGSIAAAVHLIGGCLTGEQGAIGMALTNKNMGTLKHERKLVGRSSCSLVVLDRIDHNPMSFSLRFGRQVLLCVRAGG